MPAGGLGRCDTELQGATNLPRAGVMRRMSLT